uniref:Uncharacterized protein n=1 Tax=Micrurus spixii TaxID=129469 RepID=A0A2D4MDK6_9SAUR
MNESILRMEIKNSKKPYSLIMQLLYTIYGMSNRKEATTVHYLKYIFYQALLLYVYVEPTTVKDDNIYSESTFIVYMYSFLVIAFYVVTTKHLFSQHESMLNKSINLYSKPIKLYSEADRP